MKRFQLTDQAGVTHLFWVKNPEDATTLIEAVLRAGSMTLDQAGVTLERRPEWRASVTENMPLYGDGAAINIPLDLGVYDSEAAALAVATRQAGGSFSYPRADEVQ